MMISANNKIKGAVRGDTGIKIKRFKLKDSLLSTHKGFLNDQGYIWLSLQNVTKENGSRTYATLCKL